MDAGPVSSIVVPAPNPYTAKLARVPRLYGSARQGLATPNPRTRATAAAFVSRVAAIILETPQPCGVAVADEALDPARGRTGNSGSTVLADRECNPAFMTPAESVPQAVHIDVCSC